jgi:hypothetical protein
VGQSAFRVAKYAGCRYIHGVERAIMRAETVNLVEEIKQSVRLLRRHL